MFEPFVAISKVEDKFGVILCVGKNGYWVTSLNKLDDIENMLESTFDKLRLRILKDCDILPKISFREIKEQVLVYKYMDDFMI